MNQNQISKLKDMLLQEKEIITKRLQDNHHYGMEEPLNTSVGELSGYDNHPADLGSELFERGKDLALNEHNEHQLEEIISALDRLEEGTYGICVICGKEIPYERLEAVPTTRYCIEHQPNKFASETRPIEEQFMAPPFGRLSFDEKENETEFDSEDAWQEVARFNELPYVDYADVEMEDKRGYVEQLEGFIVTDITGNPAEYDVVRNNAYEAYIDANYDEEDEDGNLER
ncbi:TraR/DksA C4-type zinc finger protein [Microaerobacter geothermalis]|uniref:TraR/DksA C4-type zinc finger protein n=1 Tax=Microaerobacter geothermalis TaxID=674972 RepID=UPI001F1F7FC8|nr:TraR/DksA C4-type zinc finger protein [Microaerobacter geothermalis]MCF6094757.1 TraR/DksA C4-type zinc finger protein [Microaerobacter geothermalis]